MENMPLSRISAFQNECPGWAKVNPSRHFSLHLTSLFPRLRREENLVRSQSEHLLLTRSMSSFCLSVRVRDINIMWKNANTLVRRQTRFCERTELAQEFSHRMSSHARVFCDTVGRPDDRR